MPHYEATPAPFLCFDFNDWHPGCLDVRLLPNHATGVPWLVCNDCRCTVQLDLVAPHVTPHSTLAPKPAREVV